MKIPLSERLAGCATPPDLSMFHIQAKALARTLDEMVGSGEYFQTRMREVVYSLYREEDEDSIQLYIVLALAPELKDDCAERLLRFILLDPFVKTIRRENP